MSAFTSVDVATINTAGLVAFEKSNLIENLKTEIASSNADVVNEALAFVVKLSKGVDQWIEPYLVNTLPVILDALAVAKTAEAAKEAGNAVLAKSNSHSIRLVTNVLYESFTSMKWQTKKGALVLLGSLAAIHPVVVQRNLPEMILKLIDIASDVKKEVKEQTKVAFTEICSTITNVDIIPIIPSVVNGYTDPVKMAEKALDSLISTTFINDVDLPTLGLLVPILIKGMREKKVVVKRRAALVIGNMCKLVNDPRTAATFYPILKPILERGIDEIAVEEVRKVCQDSLNTLQRVSAEAQVLSDAVATDEQLKTYITEAFTNNGVTDVAQYNTLTDHMSHAMHFLVHGNHRNNDDWNQCILPYIKSFIPTEEAQAATAAEIYAKGIIGLSPEKVDPEDEEEDLCNAQFSLAYGTRVLLHQTPFRVKIGRKYGLVGPK